MIKINLTEKDYEKFENCRNYIQVLLSRDNIETDDVEFIEEIFSIINSNIEF